MHSNDSGISAKLPKSRRNAAVYDRLESSNVEKKMDYENFSEFRRKNSNSKHQKPHETSSEKKEIKKIDVFELSCGDHHLMERRFSSPEIVELQ